MKALKITIVLIILALFMPGWLIAQEENKNQEKRWLAHVSKRGDFSVKFYFTEKLNDDIVQDEKLLIKYPNGQYDQPVKLSNDTLHMLTEHMWFDIYIEIWHKSRLMSTIDEWGMIDNFKNFEDLITTQADYPKPGQVTYSLYFNTRGASSITGVDYLMVDGPAADYFSLYAIDCYYDVLFAAVAGEPGNKSIVDNLNTSDGAAVRPVCDGALDFYGHQGHWGLPRPARLIVFEDDKAWRADKPGELPDYYFWQLLYYFEKFPYEKRQLWMNGQIKPEDRLNKVKVEQVGREFMAYMMATELGNIDDNLQLAFAAYCLIMMGFDKQEVENFFLAMIEEYIKAKGGFDWADKSPKEVFSDIVSACENFNPLGANEKLGK